MLCIANACRFTGTRIVYECKTIFHMKQHRRLPEYIHYKRNDFRFDHETLFFYYIQAWADSGLGVSVIHECRVNHDPSVKREPMQGWGGGGGYSP